MLTELVKIEALSFNMSSRDLFYKTLNVINGANIWPKNLDYEGQSVVVAGNIRVAGIDKIIKQSALSSRLGLYLVFPLMAFNNNTIYFDQLKIEVREGQGQSVVNIYGRLHYGRIGSPAYSKAYSIEYSDFRRMLVDSAMPRDIGLLKAGINKKLQSDRFMAPYWLSLLTTVTLIIVLIYLMYGLF